MPEATGSLNVALFPGVPWLPAIADYQAGHAPDPLFLYEIMRKSRINVDVVDPYPFPANPFAHSNQLYRGLDLVRAADVIFRSKKKYDLIISIFESSAFFPLLLRKLTTPRPLLAIWDIDLTEWRARKFVQRLVLPRVDHIFVLSTYQIRLLKEQWNRRHGVTFIGQHIDTEFYRRDPDVEEEDYILAIGEDAGRDFATLLEAAAQFPANLVIKTTRSLNIPSGLRGRVRQISDRLDWRDLRKLYSSCKMVVVPLHTTGNVSGVGSTLEAMSMAKPLVVSNNPAMVDYLRDGHTCLVVPPHDPGALAHAVNMVLTNPAIAGDLGRRARDFVVQNHAQPVFARQLADTIRSVVEEMRAGRGTG